MTRNWGWRSCLFFLGDTLQKGSELFVTVGNGIELSNSAL